MSNLYRNKNFNARDYETTNVVACLAETAPNENYVETTHEELNALVKSPLEPLWIENGVQFYGFL